ncbi:MAG: hypothetical protein LKG11_01215 [Bacilli bacterium]|jgi:hypothetical protein|nr:hypothetical protein [Bacilli bacterium]
MKVGVTKEKIGDFFTSYGWVELLLAIVSVVAWYWPITAIDQIRSDERINFFIECYGFKDEKFQSQLQDDLADNGVEEVNVYSYSPSDSLINSYYEAFGTKSDFLFLLSSDLDTMFEKPSAALLREFLVWGDALKKEVMPNFSAASFYEVEGVPYALKVYDPDNASYSQRIEDFAVFHTDEKSEAVYLLLNATTPNYGSYVDGSATSNAVAALSMLIERYYL